MSNLSIASVINKNELASGVPWLVAIKVDVVDPATLLIDTTLRIVDNNEDITLGGELFVASNFSLDIQESQQDLPTISLKVVDITQTVQRYMQKFQGGIGSHVTVYFFPAPSIVIAKAEMSYEFDIITASASSSDYAVSWQLGAENPLTMPIPARRQSKNRCSWQFKGAECGYVGVATTCDLDYNSSGGCSGRSNKDRFGGYPAIQSRSM